ncbi:MAG: outer membrane protein assembly factor BamA [Planctomycetota bacterium]
MPLFPRARRPVVVLVLQWLALASAAVIGVPREAIAAPEVEFDVQGNHAWTQNRILSEIAFWLEDLRADPRDEAAIVDAAYALEGIYQQLGYPEVKVDGSVRRRRSGAWKVTLRIEEGPLYRLGDVHFQGVTRPPIDSLEGVFPWPHTGLLSTGAVVFTPGALRSGLDGVRLLYRLAGFLDVRVSATTSEDRSSVERGGDEVVVDVDVQVSEGPQYRVSAVEISTRGNVSEDAVRAAASVAADDVYNPRVGIEARNRVLRWLQNQGYFRAEVTLRVEPVETRFRLRLDVNEGEIHQIDHVEVTGNDDTATGWVRRTLGIRPRGLYSIEAIESGRRVLLRSGLFRQVRVETVAAETSQQVVVRVAVEEKEPLRVAIKTGFGSYELGRLGVELLHRNLLGQGVQGQVRGKGSFRGEEAEGTLRYPFLLRRNLALELRSLYRRFEEVSFERQEVIGTISLDFTPRRHYNLEFGYEVRDEQVGKPDPGLPPELRADSRSALLFVETSRETRNSLLDATEGSVTDLRLEYATPVLGSQLEFLRLVGRLTWHWPLAPEWVVVASARAGTILPLQREEIPVGERFFLGGARTVRSFRQDQLGPKDAGGDDPVGGEAFIVGNLELRFPLYRQLSGAAFVDAGSLVDDHNDLAGREYRFAAGGGLIWKTPIGPLRVDGAGTLNRQDQEDSWAVHFVLGHPF